MEAVLALLVLTGLAAFGLAFGVLAAREAARPRPALPLNCGDCRHMLLRAKVYKRDTVEDPDGIVHYLCEKRWIEVTPASPWCELGVSKSRVLVGGKLRAVAGREEPLP